MTALSARLWMRALSGLALAALAACGQKDVVKEEPTPIPPTALTPAPPQPSTTVPGATPPAEIVEGETGVAGDEQPDDPA